MKANELRIGNLFYRMHRGGPIHIPETSIVLKACSVGTVGVKASLSHQIEAQEDDYTFTRHSNTCGIPLTEEWLLKFGFEKHASSPVFEHASTSKFELLYKGDCYDAECMGIVLANLKYVHQLQNLFFALTGEELTIKL